MLVLLDLIFCFVFFFNILFIYFFHLFLLVGGQSFSISSWVLPSIDLNQPWIYMCSPSWPPLPPPSPSHPSGSSQYTSPEHLSHASNLGWWSVSPFHSQMGVIIIVICYTLLSAMGFAWDLLSDMGLVKKGFEYFNSWGSHKCPAESIPGIEEERYFPLWKKHPP